MAKLKIALIGAGVIGTRHLAAMQQVPDIELVGIADPVAAAQTIAESAGVAFFDNATALLDNTRLDGVIIATPTEHHLDPTMTALENGVPVLVEKPIMATTEQADVVIARSEALQCPVLVGHHRRYYGLVNRAREIIQSGSLGKIVAICGQWNMRKHAEYYEPNWRRQWQAGPILTNLIHDIDLLRYLLGDLVSISAETSNIVQGFEKEDAAAMVMRFQSGSLGTFILSDQTHSPWAWEQATGENASVPPSGENSFHIMGTDGALEFPNLKLWKTPSRTAQWRNPLEATDGSMLMEDAFVEQLNHFCQVIRGAEKPRISARDATQTLRATLAVYEAARTGTRVML